MVSGMDNPDRHLRNEMVAYHRVAYAAPSGENLKKEKMAR
jgi:hypothetical protein